MTDLAEQINKQVIELPEQSELNRIKSKFSKFKDRPFRSSQPPIINFLLESNTRITILQASTGFGKSLVGMVAGAGYGEFTYLVSSKQLQDQLEQDFPEVAVMKGRNNYKCKQFPMLSAAECTHTPENPCGYKSDCNYELAKNKALISKYRVLNYHYFLTVTNYTDKFTGNSLIICDEADLLEFLLTDFICLSIPGQLIKEYNIPLPKYKTTKSDKSLSEWLQWSEIEVRPVIQRNLNKTAGRLSGNSSPDQIKKLIKKRNQLSGIISKLDIFKDNLDNDWIMETKKNNNNTPDTITFKPVWFSSNLAEQFFFRHTKKLFMMSATFPPVSVMSKIFGLNQSDFKLKDIPSTFAVKNRPVILKPCADMSFKTFDKDLPKLLADIRDILDNLHPDEKGIIHTVSYKLRDAIMTINNPRLITHDSFTRTETIDNFKQSDSNPVLVSPSINRGVDFPGKECTFVICAKAPFKSLADKLTQTRVYSSVLGQLWYQSLTAQEIVQQCGRGVRSDKDQCISYMLDKQIFKLITQNPKLFPKYFMDAVDF